MSFLSDADSVTHFPSNLLDERVLDLPTSILDLLPIGVHICDRDGVIDRYNRSAAELWARNPKPGDPAERFNGAHRLWRLDGSELQREEFPAAEVLRTGASIVNHPLVCERPDGPHISVLVNANALKDARGNIIGAISCSQDVTAFKRIQTLLRDSERRSRGMLESLPVAVYSTDAEGRITFYNQAAVDLWGRRPEIGQNEWCGSWHLYRPDGAPLPHDECPMAMALKEGRAINGVDAVAERPGGTRVSFCAYPAPLLDQRGEIVGALNALIDVTERERAKEIGQRLVSIVESLQDAIVGKDLNGIITSWNRGAEQLFGYGAEEIIGKPVTILIPSDRADEEPEILSRSAPAKTSIPMILFADARMEVSWTFP
jgi:PAS domain S-box-containing protein